LQAITCYRRTLVLCNSGAGYNPPITTQDPRPTIFSVYTSDVRFFRFEIMHTPTPPTSFWVPAGALDTVNPLKLNANQFFTP
jgi:hypothetical protein